MYVEEHVIQLLMSHSIVMMDVYGVVGLLVFAAAAAADGTITMHEEAPIRRTQ